MCGHTHTSYKSCNKVNLTSWSVIGMLQIVCVFYVNLKNSELWGLQMLFHSQNIAAFTCLLSSERLFVQVDLHS